MFDFKNKIKTQPKTEDNSEILSSEKVKEILTDKEDNKKVDLSKVLIHSMPEKFFASNDKKITNTKGQLGKKKISGLQKNILIGILIGVLVISLLSLAAFLFLKTIESPQNKQLAIEQPQSALQSPESTEIQEQEFNKEILEQEKLIIEQEIEEEFIVEEILEQELILLPALDTDNDLLTDTEEELWATDLSEQDTDNDGYLDGEEILNFYDPNSNQGGKLVDANLTKNYVNSDFGYSITYPAKWEMSTNQLNDQIIFTSTTGEFVQIIIQENYSGFLSAKSWYLSQNSTIDEKDLEEILIGNWSGVRSPDKLNVYLINNNYIYIIAMNVGLKNELNYSTTFEMMLNSFKLFENPL